MCRSEMNPRCTEQILGAMCFSKCFSRQVAKMRFDESTMERGRVSDGQWAGTPSSEADPSFLAMHIRNAALN